MVLWLNRAAMIVLFQGFCYIKYIKIYIVLWIMIITQCCHRNLTRLQKNMVALENLAPSESLAPPTPLHIQPPPLIVRSPSAFEI